MSSEIYSSIIRSDLALAGFFANEDKSVWVPVHLIAWLGIVWDGLQGKISITKPRIDKALYHIDNTFQDPRLSARGLASNVGKVISMSPVLGNLSRIMIRHCQMSRLQLPKTGTVCFHLIELQFWKNNLRSVNFKTVSDLTFPFISIYSDANNVACAGHIAGKDVHAHRMFTEAERQESSTYGELLAVQFVLSSVRSFLTQELSGLPIAKGG